MSHNSFGHLFRVTTWGESHGPAIGCVIDGCPPGIALTAAEIQAALDLRKPGTSKFVTQRREPDEVKILSGVFEDDRTGGLRTTGTPISLLIENVDQRSKDYSDIRDTYRPGHADFTYDAKYGFRDYRGGGRSSARETACRVAAGAVARKVLDHLYGGVVIRGCLVQMGKIHIDRARFDWDETARNPFWSPDAVAAEEFELALEKARKAGSSLGAVIEIVASGAPAGLGAPVYGKLDADLAAAMMSINAVKGVEIGAGMAAAALTGEENADEIRLKRKKPHFLSNNAGGILGGISTGQDIVARFAVKPTSSILSPRKTITRDGKEAEISTKGRHDPCVGIRAVPVGVAMMAATLADHALRHRAQCGS
ncbi:MAG: chorismate synthase [Alphaproteobacteria bacterium RIFCSPHIGHO2_12_FULL_63_12]|nr:MAG: chorismate synthase [Alphaproteobacteria bacterium RIFCSPHIGHO2_12_FULL_63_12]